MQHSHWSSFHVPWKSPTLLLKTSKSIKYEIIKKKQQTEKLNQEEGGS